MSPKVGLIGYHSSETYMKPYSESTNEVIDEEVRRIVEECYARTKEILLSKKVLIEK